MKKILALFVVLLVAVMIFACGGNGDDPTTPAATTTQATTTTPTTQQTQQTTKEPEITTTEPEVTTTKPVEITTGMLVDIDFANGTVTDKKNNASFTVKGTPVVGKVEVTFNGVTKTVDALHINASGSFVKGTLSNVADSAAMDAMLAKGWTVEAFYLDNSAAKAVRGIVCVTQANKGWGIAERATGVPYFITGNGSGYNSVDATAAISTAELVHVVAVFDPVAKTHSIYVNGVLSATATNVTTVLSADVAEVNEGFNMFNVFYLGGDPKGSGTGAADFPSDNLIIADAKIYVGALTAADVKAAYDAHVAEFVPPVVPEGLEEVIVDLDFSKIENGIIADLSGNNNFATLTGNATVADGKITFTENGAYLTIKNCAGLNFKKTESFKIEITFQASEQTVTDAGSGKWPCLLQKGGAKNGWWGIWVNGGKQYVWGGLNTTIGGASKNNPPFAACDTAEHTVLVIQDGKAGKLYLYVDGNLAIEADAMDYSSDLDLWIGGNVGNKVHQFYGSISKFSVTKYVEKTTDHVMVENGYDLDKYTKLDLTPVLAGYYNSTSTNPFGITADGSSFCGSYWTTAMFQRADLPAGSVIVILDSFSYIPEGWIDLNTKNASADRPAATDATIVEVTDEWWGNWYYRAFNICLTNNAKDAEGNYRQMTEADLGVFAIYVPTNEVPDPEDPEDPIVPDIPNPEDPEDPDKPVVPDPEDPTAPIVPDIDGGLNTDPVEPETPVIPADPEDPTAPINPDVEGSLNTDPVEPETPVIPADPEDPTAPITPDVGLPEGPVEPEEPANEKLYADLFLTSGGYMADMYGRVNLEFKGKNVAVKNVEVTLNGITKTVPAIQISALGSWVKGTLTDFASNTEFNNFVEANGGWTVEAFYLNKTKTGIQGIVCVTEGNGKNGVQGWGIADNAGCPYFLTGTGSAYASTGQTTVKTDAVNLVHVVGVYDTNANLNSLYINGKLVNTKAANGFACANEKELYEGFNMYNVFYIGSDPTVQKKPNGDFPASALTVVDFKLYAGALTAAEVTEAYNNAIAPFAN